MEGCRALIHNEQGSHWSGNGVCGSSTTKLAVVWCVRLHCCCLSTIYVFQRVNHLITTQPVQECCFELLCVRVLPVAALYSCLACMMSCVCILPQQHLTSCFVLLPGLCVSYRSSTWLDAACCCLCVPRCQCVCTIAYVCKCSLCQWDCDWGFKQLQVARMSCWCVLWTANGILAVLSSALEY